MNALVSITARSVLVAFVAGLLGFGFVGEKAHAVPITGKLAFEGMFELNGTGLADATAFTSFSGVEVTSGSGDYASVPVGTAVDYRAEGFSFNPLDPDPVAPLWSFTLLPGPTDYSFDLNAVSVVLQNEFVLVLQGTGTARITGFEDTAGSWNFMSTSTGPTLFEFNNSSSVPEGGTTIALLSFSFIGIGALRRKLAAAASS